ncbi:hypothetical protein C8Q75DRAFT_804185 [Abortiporus biennis]|nr:hypothetical protein C8Q75DRAFT_804185 [Abortiporus biennis]
MLTSLPRIASKVYVVGLKLGLTKTQFSSQLEVFLTSQQTPTSPVSSFRSSRPSTFGACTILSTLQYLLSSQSFIMPSFITKFQLGKQECVPSTDIIDSQTKQDLLRSCGAEVKESENTRLSAKLSNVQNEYIKVSLELAETESTLFNEANVSGVQKALRNTIVELKAIRTQLKDNHGTLRAKHNVILLKHPRCATSREQAITMGNLAFDALHDSFEVLQFQNSELVAEKTSLKVDSLSTAYDEQQIVVATARKGREDQRSENAKLNIALKKTEDVKTKYELERAHVALAEVELLKAQLQEVFATKEQVQSLLREKGDIEHELTISKDHLEATQLDFNDLTEVQYELDDARTEGLALNAQFKELQQN